MHHFIFYFSGAPEEPFLTLGGEKLRNGSRVSVQEREEVEVGCVARRAVPAVRHIHWRLGETNLTAASNLLVEFSPQEDSYTSRSVLVLNASRDLHGLELSCHIYHMSWSTFVAVSASVDVLCKLMLGLCSVLWVKLFEEECRLELQLCPFVDMFALICSTQDCSATLKLLFYC